MTAEEIYARLLSLAEPEYRAFIAGLLPGVSNILGVRMPALRKLAKKIAAGDWRAYLGRAREDTYEEAMLQALVIGLAKGDPEEILRYAAAFLPKITNWGLCDSFCAGLKIARQQPGRVWDFLQPCFSSPEPFTVRFALVMALNYYIEDDYIEAVLSLLDGVEHGDYYVKMAAAWTVSVCFVRYPARTMEYLLNNALDDFTYRKSISKILESYRVSPQDKAAVRALRKSKAPGPLE